MSSIDDHFHKMYESPTTEITTKINEMIDHQSGLHLFATSSWSVPGLPDFAVPWLGQMSDIFLSFLSACFSGGQKTVVAVLPESSCSEFNLR